MVSADLARKLLSRHGTVQAQQASDWVGTFPLPGCVERFFQEVGPVDVTIESYGNPFFLPRLAQFWEFQAGYRWNGLTGERSKDWDDDWLVVGGDGGGAFILSRSSGSVLFAEHGAGAWGPEEMFPDLNTMAACLGQLGTVALEAGEDFTDEDCLMRPAHGSRALAGACELLGSARKAEFILAKLGW